MTNCVAKDSDSALGLPDEVLRKMASAYARSRPGVDWRDLYQAGTIACLEARPTLPEGRLFHVVKDAMLNEFRTFSSPVTTNKNQRQELRKAGQQIHGEWAPLEDLPERAAREIVLHLSIGHLLDRLDRHDRSIVLQHFGVGSHPMSLTEIGKRRKKPRAAIKRDYERSLARLRRWAKEVA